jgi:preprotein translocase subunit YajC
MSNLFLQASGMTNMLFMFAMLAVLVFVMVIPQRRKQKAQTNFLDELKKGQEVSTTSGMLGRIDKIDGNTVTLNVGNKNYIRVTKNSISQEITDALYPKETAE